MSFYYFYCWFEINLSSDYLFFLITFAPFCLISAVVFSVLRFFMSSTCTLDASQNCKKVGKMRLFRAFCTKSKFLQFDTNESLRKECSKTLWRGREMTMVAEEISSGHFFPTYFLELDNYIQIKN